MSVATTNIFKNTPLHAMTVKINGKAAQLVANMALHANLA